ncbi:phage terminase large subunit [Hymenobacter sp. YC55]|uniref:phage terminase large subunit n=1 Tax=Hymenobacter sp. YC55 TaxID=3034019 RepID=UPI0023F7BBB5|nr:phage terminase large subunit [Hymenobacter sp. YC55]MDF7810936.1 phage terminase large subunit [Hymenobacter sp. YC55]
MKLKLDVQEDAVNDVFRPYLLSRARYRLFWGGRSSSKSDFAMLDLLMQCLVLPYFKCLMIRKVADTIQGSIWATLKDVAEREGLEQYFFFGTSPLVIKCLLNDNIFLARGLDNPKKIKSTREPTHAIYEEANETSEDEFEVVSTTLRSSRPDAVIQEVFLFNPDQEGDYQQFWLWQKFFRDTGHPNCTTFSDMLSTEMDGEIIAEPYEVLHSTIRDNRWAKKEEIARYKRYGDVNPETGQVYDEYLYRIWYLGLWATRRTDNEFYESFRRGLHVKPTPYVPDKPILQGWDANALPYSAMLMCQPITEDKVLTLRFFYEYTLPPPRSGIRNTGKQFLLDRTANGWSTSPVFLTGDSTLRNSKIGEERSSLFEDVQAAVQSALHSNSTALWPRRNAGVMRRRDFINYVLRGGLDRVRIQIDPGCVKLIEDLEQVQTGVEGKVKPKVHDKALGATYEKLGHCADVFDYITLSLLQQHYEAFVAGRDD